MDSDRQIRLLIPPFLFFASLILGMLSTDNTFRQLAYAASGEQLLAIGGAIAAGLLPVGFIISTFTFVVLRLVFLPFGRNFETHLSPEALSAVWPTLRTTLPMDSRHRYHAAITLDHELLSPGLHSWIVRTWNVVLICAQGCMALGLSHGVAYLFALDQPAQWRWTSGVLVFFLTTNGVMAWRRTMQMLEFQSFRQQASHQPAHSSSSQPMGK